MNKIKRIKNIEVYGEGETLTETKKIDFIKNQFEQGTIKGSCIRDELYLINNEYGFYSNGWEYQFCSFTKEENDDTWSSIKYKYNTKHIKKLELDDILNNVSKEVKEKLEKIIEQKTEEYYQQSYNRLYYEIDINKEKSYGKGKTIARFYLEYKDHCFELRIDEDGYVELLNGDLEVYDNNFCLNEAVEKKINEQIEKYIDKQIIKLENGYVYKNNYYEDFETLKYFIENEDLKSKGE